MRVVISKLMKSSVLLFCLVCADSWSTEYFVDSQKAYQAIAAELVAGDTVVLKNGVWQDFEILLAGKGAEDAPITLTAETKGKVILSGQSNLRLAGKYLVVSGLDGSPCNLWCKLHVIIAKDKVVERPPIKKASHLTGFFVFRNRY